jgi:hypothetical protein
MPDTASCLMRLVVCAASHPVCHPLFWGEATKCGNWFSIQALLAAPFSMLFRLRASLFAFAYHAFVLLTTGIDFITWLAVPFAVAFPISEIVRRLRKRRGA